MLKQKTTDMLCINYMINLILGKILQVGFLVFWPSRSIFGHLSLRRTFVLPDLS